MNIVYLNGEFLPKDEAKISIFDRGFIFGDGIYEVLPVVNGKITDKEDFWERLNNSTKAIDLKIPLSKNEYFKMLQELLKLNNLKEGSIYTQITRGVAPRAYLYPINIEPTCIAFCNELDVINHPYAKCGIEVVSVDEIRWKRRDIKSISLLAQCKSKQEARSKGAFEGFMVEDGFVTEGVTSTAYIVKNNTIITTPLTNQILPGIRRKNLIKIIENLGLKIEFRRFSVEEVKQADEAFISAASLVLLPVVKIDGYPINGGKIGDITKKLRASYVEKIQKEVGLI